MGGQTRIMDVKEGKGTHAPKIASVVVQAGYTERQRKVGAVAPHCRTHEIQGAEMGRLRDM